MDNLVVENMHQIISFCYLFGDPLFQILGYHYQSTTCMYRLLFWFKVKRDKDMSAFLCLGPLIGFIAKAFLVNLL